ncbi:MAG: TRAP transporter substrate-binding protein DctP [Thermovirgaceae bacterium]
MKSKWRIVAVVLALAVLAVTAGTALAAEYEWRIGHIRPEGTEIDRDVKWLVEKIKEESNGRIVFEVYPASQLGDYTVVQERCSMGAVESQLACLGTTVSKELNLPAAPYLAKNYEEAKVLFGPGGAVYEKVAEILEAKENIHLISGWPVYFGGIGMIKEVPAPTDPNVPKNAKIRVPPIKSFELTAESLGYQATPVPWAEVFTSLQTGIVDGVIGGGAEGYYANFRDLLNSFHANNDHFEMWWWYMNKDLWDSLSKEDQELLMKLGRELEAKRWAEAPEAEKKNMQRLADEGVEIITFTDEELEVIAGKVRAEVWPNIKREIGESVYEEVMAPLMK